MNTATAAPAGISGTQVSPNSKAGDHLANQGGDMSNRNHEIPSQLNVTPQADASKLSGSHPTGAHPTGSLSTGSLSNGSLSNGVQSGSANKPMETQKPGESNKGTQDNKSADGNQAADSSKPGPLTVAASSEMSNLRADLDALISRIPHLADAELSAAKEILLQKYGDGKKSVSAVASVARDTITHGMEAAGDYVKDRPLKTVAVTAGIGILIGMLIGRGR